MSYAIVSNVQNAIQADFWMEALNYATDYARVGMKRALEADCGERGALTDITVVTIV